MKNNIIFIFILYIIYSFIGWVLESAYISITKKKFRNSGFLYGPFIPIYGYGAIFIYLLSVKILFLNIFTQIFIYSLIATILEYVTSLILEKIFSLKLWDYSDEYLNLEGRICLKHSIIWAGLIVLFIYFIHPFTVGMINKLSFKIQSIIASVFFIYFVIDTILSFKLYFNFALQLKSIREISISKLKKLSSLNIQHLLLQQIKSFLRPIRQFPNLINEIQKYKPSFSNLFTENLKIEVENILNIKEKPKKATYNEDPIFQELILEIINHPEYEKLKEFHHHQNSTYYHNIKVAWLSYLVGRRLNLKLKDLVRGALLHDFFLYNWRKEKPEDGKLHAFAHPKEALSNSKKHFAPLTLIEEDIILKHMWPLTIIPPKYIESFLVCIVDKIVATKEFSVEILNGKDKK